MFFLNLTAGEFFALLGAIGGVVTALYLLDRSKRKKIVSTLRFWPTVAAAAEQTRRKRMHQPWSLILQLLSLTLLLLAIAQLQWGSRAGRSRDHVLLLDTSVWSGAKAPGGSVIDRERQRAAQYLAALPSQDRIMLVRVDALPLPGTPFTSNREQLLNVLRDATSGASALDLSQAFSFAKQAQTWSGGTPGEITYIGPRRIGPDQLVEAIPANLRVITVPVDGENAGIRNMSVKRGEEGGNSWEAAVTLKNEGLSPRRLTLRMQFAGTRFAPRVYILRPGEEFTAKYNFVTNTAGRLLAEIDSDDSLFSDNRAELQLPANKNLTVAAYTKRRDLLRPLLDANHHLTVHYFDPSEYMMKPAADLVLLDSFAPQGMPLVPSLWLHPSKENSPLPIKTAVKDAVIKTWHTDALLQTGLRTREDRIGEAEVFGNLNGAVPVASVAEGPVIAAIPNGPSHPKSAVVGFDPFAGNFRFSITTPLLFANLLQWLAPEAFLQTNFTADHVGSAAVPLAADEEASQLRVSDERGFAVPFTVREHTLQLFVDQPKIVHVVSGNNYQRTLSLTLPNVEGGQWNPPTSVATGLPPTRSGLPASLDLWKWLACLGGLGIFAEWWLFGRERRAAIKRPSVPAARKNQTTPRREKELISR